MKRLIPFSLTSCALAAVLLGCGPLPEPLPPGTSGAFCGNTTGGGSGSSGSTGGTGGSSGTTGTICEEVECAEGCGFLPVPEGSCPVCGCPATCTTNADCPRGDYCDFSTDGGEVKHTAIPVAHVGTCEPVQVCPAIACPIDDPTQVCTTGTDANGCPTCACQPAPTQCQASSDCPPGDVCVNACACNGNRPCPDCVSLYGTCQAAPPPPPSCQTNADCPSGDVCVNACQCNGNGPCPDCASLNGTCQAAPPPPPSCNSDADCAIGTTCQPGPIDPCPAGEACNTVLVANECLPAPTCSTNADCRSGEICGPNPADPCTGPAQTCNVVLPNICQLPPTT